MQVNPKFIEKDANGKVAIVPSSYPDPADFTSTDTNRPLTINSSLEIVPMSSGTLEIPGVEKGIVQVVTFASSLTIDCSLSNLFQVTATGNFTIYLTNLQPTSYSWLIKQDATGSRTITFPAGTPFKFPGGTKPTLSTSANAVDLLVGFCDGTNVYGFLHKAFA